MSFYHFNQNNSGGRFVRTEALDHHVFIEAASQDEAVAKAESIGIYFDGCDSGSDCPCCGDRWSVPYGDPTAQPEVYGEVVGRLSTKRELEKHSIVVHFADGRVRYGVYASKYPDLALSDGVSDSPRVKITKQTKADVDKMVAKALRQAKAR